MLPRETMIQDALSTSWGEEELRTQRQNKRGTEQVKKREELNTCMTYVQVSNMLFRWICKINVILTEQFVDIEDC